MSPFLCVVVCTQLVSRLVFVVSVDLSVSVAFIKIREGLPKQMILFGNFLVLPRLFLLFSASCGREKLGSY